MLRNLKLMFCRWRRWQQKNCSHKWKLLDNPVFSQADDGDLIATADVRCKKCGLRRQNQVKMLCFSTTQVKRLRQIKSQMR